MTVLCNQPEAFTLDLGDDQSRYLLVVGWSSDVKCEFITNCAGFARLQSLSQNVTTSQWCKVTVGWTVEYNTS